MMTEAHPAWHIFAALQDEADPHSIDRSLARDEALDAFLDEIVDDPATDPDRMRKRFHSLCRNRASKQNNRRAVSRRHFKISHRRAGSSFGSVLLTAPAPTVANQLAYTQLIGLLRTVLSDAELTILLEIADDNSHAEMASAHKMTFLAVKAKAFRIREKVRRSAIADVLRRGLTRSSDLSMPQPREATSCAPGTMACAGAGGR